MELHVAQRNSEGFAASSVSWQVSEEQIDNVESSKYVPQLSFLAAALNKITYEKKTELHRIKNYW